MLLLTIWYNAISTKPHRSCQYLGSIMSLALSKIVMGKILLLQQYHHQQPKPILVQACSACASIANTFLCLNNKEIPGNKQINQLRIILNTSLQSRVLSEFMFLFDFVYLPKISSPRRSSLWLFWFSLSLSCPHTPASVQCNSLYTHSPPPWVTKEQQRVMRRQRYLLDIKALAGILFLTHCMFARISPFSVSNPDK